MMQQNKEHLFLPYGACIFNQKIRSFNVNETFMMFYCRFNESALSSTLVSWCDLLNHKNKNMRQGIVRKCCKTAGLTLT